MSNNTTGPVDKEIQEIYALFFDGNPITADIIDTSREEGDFRQAVLIRDSMDELLSKVQTYSYNNTSGKVMTQAEQMEGTKIDFRG